MEIVDENEKNVSDGDVIDEKNVSDSTNKDSLGFIRDPFFDRPDDIKQVMLRQTKRTQRYRSTAKSRIIGMTVGDIRYCFQQLRSAGSALSPYLVLYNGQYAGEFALAYLIETSNSMRKRRRKKQNLESEDVRSVDSIENLPESQLQNVKNTNNIYLMEF